MDGSGELMPEWLSLFITGVVDLSETATERSLQQNLFLRTVKKTLVVKCLDLCVKWQREK